MTERVDIQQVLLQMRTVKAQAQQGAQGISPFPGADANRPSDVQRADFGELLKSAVDKVNQQQQTANNLTKAFEQGDPNVDLPEVMINMQKASVSFQAMLQVRNRLVSAYTDIMKMPI